MTTINCLICNNEQANLVQNNQGFDGHILECPRCGSFSISGSAIATWTARITTPRQIANASGWIREHQGISINSDDIKFLVTIKTPSVAERADKVLQAISKQNIELSDRFSITSELNIDLWLGISYSYNYIEIKYLFYTYLKSELNYLAFMDTQYGNNTFEFKDIFITPKGYAYLDTLSRSTVSSHIGFCAMWFDARLLKVWEESISPAIKDAGYDAKRIDKHQHNNRIDDEIIAMLRQSKFVVADFVGNRAGVYFEAGFALGLGLPVIWTCNRSKLHRIHFDNRQYNFVTWEWNKLDEFKLALQNRIEATLGRGNFS